MGERTMENDPAEALASLVHDVKSTCSNLKCAAERLRGDSTNDELELLALMSEQARSLADAIAAYETARREKSRG